MPDTVHHVMWYTVYDAKTGDLIAGGTSEMCARRLGYKNANSFASACSHSRSGRHPARKYAFARERIERGEVDTDELQGMMDFTGHITPKNNTIRRICKWQLCRFMTGLKTRRNF